MMESYLAFDFETSGLNPTRDRIIQVGYCTVVGGQVTDSGGWLVNQAIRIPREAVAVHGITTEVMMDGGIDPGESLARLIELMSQSPTCIGHNIHLFDIPFMNAEALRLRLTPPDSRDFVDTAALYKGWKLGLPHKPAENHSQYAQRVLSIRCPGLKYSIPACVRELQAAVDLQCCHDASRDAHATHLIYQQLQSHIKQEERP